MYAKLKAMSGAVLASVMLLATIPAHASGGKTIHVTITNLTHAIIFTPVLVASHRRAISVFDLGSAASDDLKAIAEGGDTGPLTTTLNHNRQVVEVANSGAPLGAGESVTVVVSAGHGARWISIASMLLPTNDGFIALQNARVPQHGSATYFSPGYDAGSETNDELCANIPGGGSCSGMAGSPGDDPVDEGYVHIHRGIHGVGDLDPSVYDWRNPVAKVTVERVRGD